MKNKLGRFIPFIIIIFILSISACGSSETQNDIPETGQTETSPLTQTNIVIDGDGSDWVDRPVLVDDPAGDAEAGYLDLTTSYAFVNQDALYFLVDVVDPTAPFVQFDFELNGDNQHQMLTWRPGMQFNYSTIEFGSALEARIDLRDIGSPEENVRITEIRVMVGEDYPSPSWRSADVLKHGAVPIAKVNEFDAPEVKNSSDGPNNTNAKLSIPKIILDGYGDDWVDVPVLVSDPAGDQIPLMGDLAEVRAFRTDKNLYMMIGLHEDGYLGHLIFQIAGPDNDAHQLNVWPGGLAQYTRQQDNPLEPVILQSVRGEVVEIRISLDELGFVPVSIHSIQTCCVNEDERMDTIDTVFVTVTTGEEALTDQVQERTERPVHFRLENNNLSGDYLYRLFLQTPTGMDVGPDGMLYIADWNGFHIVRLSPNGEHSDLGLWRNPDMFTSGGPQDVAFDPDGELYFTSSGFIYHYLGDGAAERVPGTAGWPDALDFGADGTLYFTDIGQGNVYRLKPGGVAEPLVQDRLPRSIVIGADGVVYYTRWPAGDIVRIDPETGAVDDFYSGACNFDPCFLDVDPEGDIWVRGIFDLRQFSPDGVEKPYSMSLSGKVVPGNNHGWHSSAGIAFDPEGNLWIGSYNSWLHRLVLTNPGDATPIFERQVVSAGFEASDLDVGPDGSVYATDLNGLQVLRVTPDGEARPVIVHGSAGRDAVAVNSQGVVYYSAFGQIWWVDETGNANHYAPFHAERMVFSGDGNLYATTVGEDGQRSIVRITGVDQFEVIGTELNGDVFGYGEVFLMRAPDDGLLVLVQNSGNLYRMSYTGQAEFIGQIPGRVMPVAASPITGTVYFLMTDPDRYTLKSIDLDGTIRILGNDFSGDPWGMAVSPDGKWLYIAESGAIDRISLVEVP